MRDLVRRAVDARDIDADPTGLCVAALSCVYDHHIRVLADQIRAEHNVRFGAFNGVGVDPMTTTSRARISHHDRSHLSSRRG